MPSDRPIYEFGPFRLDSGKRVLLRHGHSVALRQKALETLLVLVENYGQLVGKETLMEKVWPDTFVEEGNLTFTIHLLRKTLGDERNNANRFIETVPRRGYRFVAEVGLAQTPQNGQRDSLRDSAASLPEAGTADLVPRAVTQSRPHRGMFWFLIAGFVALAFVAVIAVLTWRAPLPSPHIVRYTQLTSDGRTKLEPILTDGTRLFFQERTPEGTTSLVSVPTTVGDPVPIAMPFQDFTLIDISPQHSEFLLGTPASRSGDLALWRMSSSGGAPHRLGDLTVRHARWSPDGGRIVYSKGQNLYVAGSDGTDSRLLAPLSGDVTGLAWSPDGKTLRIAVSFPERDALELWDIAAAGGKPSRVAQGWQRAYTESWTPDGRYFLFTANVMAGSKKLIWALPGPYRFLRRAPGAPVQLASSGPIEFTSEVPSLDGRKIFALGEQHRPELMRYDARLGEFVPYLSGIPAYWASVSPDGRSVAYLSLPQHALWRARADGTHAAQLTFAPLEGDGFAWSPDGKQIALRARKPGQPWRIYLVPAEGGVPRQLTEGTAGEGVPSWSPDGRRIVYGDYPPTEYCRQEPCSIHTADLETGNVTDLPGSKGLWTARWSPDGRYIAAVDNATRQLRIFDRMKATWHSFNTPRVNNPSWTHNGKYVYFDSEENDRAIYRVRIRDGRLERFLSLYGAGFPTVWGSGLAPDDSPLITRDIGFTEVYALDIKWP